MSEFWLVFHKNNRRRFVHKGTYTECAEFIKRKDSDGYILESFLLRNPLRKNHLVS